VPVSNCTYQLQEAAPVLSNSSNSISVAATVNVADPQTTFETSGVSWPDGTHVPSVKPKPEIFGRLAAPVLPTAVADDDVNRTALTTAPGRFEITHCLLERVPDV
jgi:hypothetical protein